MEKQFKNKKDYQRQTQIVFDYYTKLKNTLISHLKEHGDYIIPTEDRHEWKFCFLDMEGIYQVNAVRLSEQKDDLYLDAVDENRNTANIIYWDSINFDMVIVQMLMSIVWPD